MEAAIAAMSAGIPALTRDALPLKRGIELVGDESKPMDNKKRKKKQSKKKSAAAEQHSRSTRRLLARTLEGAKYIIVDGRITDASGREDFTSRDATAIRRCFVAVANTKKQVISLIDELGADEEKSETRTVFAKISSLNFGDLIAATSQTKIAHETVSEGITLIKQLKKLTVSDAKSTASATLLRILQTLDVVYSELLALNASLGSKSDRFDLLPDPAVYIWWCALTGDTEMFMKPSANPLLSYLKYRHKEAARVHLSSIIADIVAQEGLRDGPHEGTMRGTCPITSPTLSLWRDVCRDRICQWSAFACPDKDALDLIRRFCPANSTLLELGAGTGYWAYLLRREGLSVLATDKTGSSSTLENSAKNMNEYHGWFPHWSTVQTLVSTSASASATHNSNAGYGMDTKSRAQACDVLLLVYPPPNNAMAADALSLFRGDRFILVGEFHGDTADKRFERKLYQEFICAGVKRLPNWINTAARISFWVRKRTPSSSEVVPLAENLDTSPMLCGGCGVCLWSLLHSQQDVKSSVLSSSSFFYRDRLTRCVYACSQKCAASEGVSSLIGKEAQERHLQGIKVPDSIKFKKIYCN